MEAMDISDAQVMDLARSLPPRQVRIFLKVLGIITTQEAADLLGLGYQRLKGMRTDGVPSDVPHPNRLPLELPIGGVSPLYLTRELVEWGKQTGRIGRDGLPITPRPAGRPPRVKRRIEQEPIEAVGQEPTQQEPIEAVGQELPEN